MLCPVDHAPLPALGPGLQRSWSASLGGGRLRVVPWQGDRYLALVGPSRTGRPPRHHEVVRCLDELAKRGVRTAVTPALSALDALPFLAAGFQTRENLHLLAYDLSFTPTTKGRPLRAGRTWHRRRVLEIDGRAFEPFWRFDANALSEARRATPSHRFRVALDDGHPVGYAVTGRAGDRGYLQRLAVDPDHEGGGIATDLVHDALQWLRQRGASTAMVNTQERNQRALRLYEHLGFVREEEGLVVLHWDA